MAWTPYQKFLAILMIVTGSINTLSTKWADKLYAVGSDGVNRKFQHPFLQSSFMFLGEMLCLLIFKSIMCAYAGRQNNSTTSGLVRGNQNFNPVILMIPGLLDLIGTSTIYVALNLTSASSFQMFRGSVIMFTATLSVIFLKKRISVREWLGIGSVFLGLLIVGLSDFFDKDDTQEYGPNSIITGDLLIVIAQIVSALQFVYEEKCISGLDIPALQAVGWEGVFGFCALLILHVVFYFIPAPSPFANNAHGSVEDAIDGLVQIGNNGLLIVTVLGGVLSIAFFNFAGISVTKEISATTRMVIDSIRIVVIWAVSLTVKWQQFHALQLLGFFFLLLGTCIYNNVLVDRVYAWLRCRQPPNSEPIVNHDAIEHYGDEDA